MKKKILFILTPLSAITILIFLIISIFTLKSSLTASYKNSSSLKQKLSTVEKDFIKLKNEDQYKRNEKLQSDIKNIESTYKTSLAAYNKLVDLRDAKVKTDDYIKEYANILKLLSERNYASAESSIIDLNKKLDQENAKLYAAAQAAQAASQAVTTNQPPQSGYRRQTVSTEAGSFTVAIISADLNSTRVIVDTASDSTCGNNCPALSLADYVNRNGAYAGINGSFFCPESYPDCAGKTNSFDTLLMNKNKVYFNSDNNVYSVVPAVIFSGNTARFIERSLEWGRDTSVDSVIANRPLYLLNGQNMFSGASEAKLNSKGMRSFIGTNGSNVYIGFVFGASSGDTALVLKTLGLQNALGLDQGGSSALWNGGYVVGPGRNIPNAVLFVRK